MNALGLDVRTFIFQAINFVILLGGLNYFLYKPLQKLLDERKCQVTESLQAAEKLKAEVAANEATQMGVLAAARKEAQAIINEAQSHGKMLAQRLEAQAKEDATRIITHAENEAEEEKARMHRELREEMVATILSTTERILEVGIDQDEKNAHVHHLVQELHP